MEKVKFTYFEAITTFVTLNKILKYSDEGKNPIPMNIKYRIFKLQEVLGNYTKEYEDYRLKVVEEKKVSKEDMEKGNDNFLEMQSVCTDMLKKEIEVECPKIKEADLDYFKADNILTAELDALTLFIE